jgi:hypothetical protein
MELIIHIGGLRAFVYKPLNFPQLGLIACLESRRVMEDELWVVSEGERAVDIMNAALFRQHQQPVNDRET